jgi:hypothetical protein
MTLSRLVSEGPSPSRSASSGLRPQLQWKGWTLPRCFPDALTIGSANANIGATPYTTKGADSAEHQPSAYLR